MCACSRSSRHTVRSGWPRRRRRVRCGCPPTTTGSDVQVLVLPTRDTAALAVAGFLAQTVRRTPDVVFGLPTGRTMIPVYRALVRLHQHGLADFSRAITFNLDE